MPNALENPQAQDVIKWPVIVAFILGTILLVIFISVGIYVKSKPAAEIPQPKFGNISHEEYEKTMLRPIPTDSQKNTTSTANTTVLPKDQIPAKFDWREKGFVSKDVKNQGNCFICWAYSISAVMEIMLSIKNGVFTKLSDMHLFKILPDMARCKPRNHIQVLEEMKTNKTRLLTRECYRRLVTGRKRCPDGVGDVGVLNYTHHRCDSSRDVMRIIYEHGPVIALINADTWQNYSGPGIINENCGACSNAGHVLSPDCCACCRKPSLWHLPCEEQFCTDPHFNHVVVIVGYDSTAAIPHYIVLNSWGPEFGDNGFVRIAMDVCDIETSITTIDIDVH